jgi:serine protease
MQLGVRRIGRGRTGPTGRDPAPRARPLRRALSVVLALGLGATAGATLGAAAGAGRAGAAPSSPNDPLYPRQWNLAKVGAPAAWTRSTGLGVTIGVVDTGVDLRHEDLAEKLAASADCVGAAGNPASCHGTGQDDNGHGTHVAGIAAAVSGNDKGVAGMAPGARIVAAKVLDNQGNGSISDVNAGIEWVVQHGARVVNLSLGSDLPELTGLLGSSSLAPGVDYAWSHGAIPVLAAGNENFFGLGSANYGNANAVIVGATGPKDEVAPYSSPVGNAKWALVAPGGDGQDSGGNPSCGGPASALCIVSTWWTSTNPGNSYAYDQGTSMATPMVSGALALLLAQGLSQTTAVQTLLSSADHAVSCGSACAGRLDAAKAVGAAAAVSSAAVGSGAGTPAPGASGPPPAPGSGSGGGAPAPGGGGFQPGSSPALGGSSPGAPALPAPDSPGVPSAPAPPALGGGTSPGTSAGGQARAEAAPRTRAAGASDGAMVAGTVAAVLLAAACGLAWWALRRRRAGVSPEQP